MMMMRHLSRFQLACVIVWAACTLLKLGSLAFNIHVIGHTAQDAGDYYGAGYALNHGISPYDTKAWQALLPNVESGRYVYPPFWAVLWRLPALLDFATVRWMMVVINVIALCVSVWLVARACGLTRLQLGVLLVSACASVPVFGTFFLGQISFILLVLLVLALVLVPTHPTWAGVCIGVAAGIKLFPLFWVWALYRTWGWRGWLGLGLGGVTTLLIGLVGAPLTIWREYMAVGVLPDAGPPRWSMNRSGVWNVAERIFDTHSYTIDGAAYQFPAMWYQPALVVPMAGVLSICILLLTWRGLTPQSNVWWRMGLVVACMLLVMPFQYIHYTVFLLLPVGVLMTQRQHWWVLALVAVLDTAVRYQYNVVRITQQTWPASAGFWLLMVVWGWMVWQSLSVSVPQSPTKT